MKKSKVMNPGVVRYLLNEKKYERIVFAKNSKIKRYRLYVKPVLEVLKHPEALVSDESTVWDFIRYSQISVPTWVKDKLSELCGGRITGNTPIWELAKRLKARRQKPRKKSTPKKGCP